jgi:hypothetical protein
MKVDLLYEIDSPHQARTRTVSVRAACVLRRAGAGEAGRRLSFNIA